MDRERKITKEHCVEGLKRADEQIKVYNEELRDPNKTEYQNDCDREMLSFWEGQRDVWRQRQANL